MKWEPDRYTVQIRRRPDDYLTHAYSLGLFDTWQEAHAALLKFRHRVVAGAQKELAAAERALTKAQGLQPK